MLQKGNILLLICLCLALSHCSSSVNKMADKNIFENVPPNQTKYFIDSISRKIAESVPVSQTGFPTPQKGSYYYDERPVKDSQGNLKMYFVYDISSDTSEITNRFYFFENRLIAAVLLKTCPGISNTFSIYYFRNDSLFCINTNSNSVISGDSIIKLGHQYLLNKNKTGDVRFR